MNQQPRTALWRIGVNSSEVGLCPPQIATVYKKLRLLYTVAVKPLQLHVQSIGSTTSCHAG